MSRIFKRQIRVSVFRTQLEPKVFSRVEIGEVIEGLHIQFSVEKSLDKSPNPSTVRIDNLNEQSRRLVARSPVAAIVEAGYDGQLHRVCMGDVRWSQSRRVGSDWQTEMQLADGGRAFALARVNATYGAGTPISFAVKDALKEMGIDPPDSLSRIPKLQRRLSVGTSSNGNARDELTSLLKPLNLSWSIQDGRVVILGSEDTLPNDVQIISQDTGMIDSPEQGKPDKDGKPPTWTVKSILRPDLLPGQRVEVRSEVVQGRFRIETVKHDGDNMTGDFATELEVKAIVPAATIGIGDAAISVLKERGIL